jgi:hypothetical protein
MDSSPRSKRISLTMRLVHGDRQQAVFTAKQNGMHDLRVDFPWPIADENANRAMRGAVASVTTNILPPEFEFSWTLFKEDAEIQRGTATTGVFGVVDSGTYPLGGGVRKARGLVFARFWLQSGTQYRLEFVPGRAFMPLLAGLPTLEVELRGTRHS